MTAPVKLNFKIYQGSTFSEILRWESSTKVYVPITNISNGAPMVITAPGHNVPSGWRVKLSNVVGMTEVNSLDYINVTDVSGNDLTINSINAVGYKQYISGGILEYNEPISLSGTTARMQIRDKVNSSNILLTLTTENGGIVIYNFLKTIQLYISAEDTALLTFNNAVYSVELVQGSIVTPFIYGNLTLDKEITR